MAGKVSREVLIQQLQQPYHRHFHFLVATVISKKYNSHSICFSSLEGLSNLNLLTPHDSIPLSDSLIYQATMAEEKVMLSKKPNSLPFLQLHYKRDSGNSLNTLSDPKTPATIVS